MSTAKVLQIPTIIDIVGSTIRIAHPDISGYTRTSMTAPLTAGGTTLTVRDNNNYEDDDWFILGEVGDAKTEECDVNGAVTRGTSLTITNTTKFSHEIDTPVTRIFERKIKIYGASTDGGSGTLIASIDAITGDAFEIQWDRPYSEWTLISTDTTYSYYYAVFFDGTTSSSASDYVPSTGLAYNTAKKLIESALKHVKADVDGDLITWDWLLDKVNDWQDAVTSYVDESGIPKDWTFEIYEDTSSIAISENENEYALSSLTYDMKYPDSFQGIIQVKIGADELDYIDHDEMEEELDGLVRATVATAASAGDTSLVLSDTYEFPESGSAYVGEDLITFTGNTEASSTLTGIPASGTGAITDTRAVGTVVWYGVTPATPDKYTVFNGEIILNKPCESNIANRKIKFKYFKALSRLTALSNVTDITYTRTAKLYIGSEIEHRKGNSEDAETLMDRFYEELEKDAARDMTQVTEAEDYYTFSY